jgi:hypothetical protein
MTRRDPNTDDGLTQHERHRRLNALGWYLVGQNRAAGSWTFAGPNGEQRIVPTHSDAAAIRAVLRQLTEPAVLPDGRDER